jgi:membrane protein implicated in regulation of membrane protease activity
VRAVARGLRAFGLFWFDFIVGDDWTVAVAVAVALIGTWGLTRAGVQAWWLLPAVVLIITAVSLRRSVTRDHQRSDG